MQKRSSARDRGMTVQEKGGCCASYSARDRGVVVQKTKEGQWKRQGNGSAGKGDGHWAVQRQDFVSVV